MTSFTKHNIYKVYPYCSTFFLSYGQIVFHCMDGFAERVFFRIKAKCAATDELVVSGKKQFQFVVSVYKVTNMFPDDERFGLTSQFRRAAVSIAANICEGYRKLSRADKLRFMNIAQGSLEECRYYIILSRDLNYIDQKQCENLDYLINGTSWKLNGYAEAISHNKGITDI